MNLLNPKPSLGVQDIVIQITIRVLEEKNSRSDVTHHQETQDNKMKHK